MSARPYAENRLVIPTGFPHMVSLPVDIFTGQIFTSWLNLDRSVQKTAGSLLTVLPLVVLLTDQNKPIGLYFQPSGSNFKPRGSNF